MAQSLILAIDQGGQSSRVAIYTSTGECLHSFSAACTTTHEFINGIERIEQSPRDILLGIKACIEKITVVLGDDVKNIVAAGFAGQGSSLLCWDNQTGEALSPVLSWQDIRGDYYLRDIPLNHTQAQQITGLRISPHYGASKMRWCLDNNPLVASAYKNNSLGISSLKIGPIVSYIFWHLLKTNLVDPGHAQRTLLWNLQNNNWDDSLLTLFNIPRALLPQCKYHNSHFGDLTLGETKIPFTASARDQGASLFARGQPEKTACYINIGTGAFIQRLSESLHAPEGLLVSPLWLPNNNLEADAIELTSPTCYAAELADDFKINSSSVSRKKLYAWEATVNGAASAISFLQEHTGMQITPAEINKALELNPEQECYFLNAVGGLSAPYWRTDLQSQFSEKLSAYEKILAWLESIIFQIAINVRLMDELGSAQKIYISGGFSKADGMCQKLADLLRIPVRRSENTDATLQGIACMAAAIPDAWEYIAEEEIFQPQPNPSLIKAFDVWQNAMSCWLSTK
jgi:glycerol kinase